MIPRKEVCLFISFKTTLYSISYPQSYLHLELNTIVDSIEDMQFDIDAHVIPHPAKKYKGGEDAFFISSDKRALGVADGICLQCHIFLRNFPKGVEKFLNLIAIVIDAVTGVGSWSTQGIDPGIYSRSLMDIGEL
jgi:hypothetical protein